MFPYLQSFAMRLWWFAIVSIVAVSCSDSPDAPSPGTGDARRLPVALPGESAESAGDRIDEICAARQVLGYSISLDEFAAFDDGTGSDGHPMVLAAAERLEQSLGPDWDERLSGMLWEIVQIPAGGAKRERLVSNAWEVVEGAAPFVDDFRRAAERGRLRAPIDRNEEGFAHISGPHSQVLSGVRALIALVIETNPASVKRLDAIEGALIFSESLGPVTGGEQATAKLLRSDAMRGLRRSLENGDIDGSAADARFSKRLRPLFHERLQQRVLRAEAVAELDELRMYEVVGVPASKRGYSIEEFLAVSALAEEPDPQGSDYVPRLKELARRSRLDSALAMRRLEHMVPAILNNDDPTVAANAAIKALLFRERFGRWPSQGELGLVNTCCEPIVLLIDGDDLVIDASPGEELARAERRGGRWRLTTR